MLLLGIYSSEILAKVQNDVFAVILYSFFVTANNRKKSSPIQWNSTQSYQ